MLHKTALTRVQFGSKWRKLVANQEINWYVHYGRVLLAWMFCSCQFIGCYPLMHVLDFLEDWLI